MNWKEISSQYISNLDYLRGLTPYEIFEVGINVTTEELRKAYRKKIIIYHPDKSDKFLMEYNQEVTKIINNAYHELKKRINE
jgi:DnaJ-class molecular chaperone